MDRDFGATISIRRIIRRGCRDNSRFFKTNLTRAPAGLGVSARVVDSQQLAGLVSYLNGWR